MHRLNNNLQDTIRQSDVTGQNNFSPFSLDKISIFRLLQIQQNFYRLKSYQVYSR